MSEPTTGNGGRHEYVMQVLEGAIRIGLLFLLALWCFLLMQPFIPLLAWGIVIAVAVYPLQAKLTIVLNGRAGLATMLITLFILSLLLLPAFFLFDSLTRSAITLYEQVNAGTLTIPAPPGKVKSWPVIGNEVYGMWSLATDNLQAVLKQLAPQIRVLGKWLLGTVMDLGFSLLKFCLSLIVAGVVMYKADAGKRFVDHLFARLMGRRHEEYVAISRDTVRSVALGVVGVAIIQSLLAGMGFFVASMPAAGLWAFLVLLMAVIQVPVLLLFIPLCIYGYSIMSPTAATLLAVWCALVGLLDNVLKPLLFGRGVDIPMLIILMGAIGGLMLTGIIGLFVGAVVLSLGYKLFLIWLDME